MKKISPFDLGVIIAFVVIGLIGGGACYYIEGLLSDAKAKVSDAKKDFDTYSVSQTYNVTDSNRKALQENIDLIKSQIDPTVQSRFLSKDNKLSTVERKDPVSWKHELVDDVTHLTAAAKAHAVKLAPDFYFGFDRYVSQNPADDKTVVLGKQLLFIEHLSNILINAPVRAITGIQRTYDEDPPARGNTTSSQQQPSRLPGYAFTTRDGTYTNYAFQVNFDTNTESLRKVMNDLTKSPYILVIRNITIDNDQSASPPLTILDQMASGTNGDASVVNSAPGEVASNSNKTPQYLFGNAPLHVKMRIDLIEWNASK